MRRVVIVGPGGAGKSTLARNLGTVLDLPVIHMDAEFWLPGWRQPKAEEWQQHVDELVSRQSWVMDGAHRDSLDRALTRADVAVLLDPAPVLLVWRLLLRRWLPHQRQDLPLPERLAWSFVRETWSYRQKIKPRVVEAVAECGASLVVLHNRRQIAAWVKTLSN